MDNPRRCPVLENSTIMTHVKRLVDSFLNVMVSLFSGVSSVCWEVAAFWARVAFDGWVRPIQERRVWEKKLQEAKTYKEWSMAAAELDRIDGKVAWKKDKVSSDYDFELIQTRLEQLQRAHELHDDAAISFLLRTSLNRNFGGIGDVRLFENCRIGTKTLIEDFNEEIVKLLKMLAGRINKKTGPVELKEKMDFFKDMRHSLGNTALLLSGGASLGMYHAGVLKALHENGLLPRIIAGASSGSIMAAIACCRREDEFSTLLNMEGINIHMLEEETPEEHRGSWIYQWSKKISRLITHGVVFDGKVLQRSLRDNIGDITFLEAYKLTSRVLNIAVSSNTMYDMPRLLNYITSPNVLVWSAVVASCAVPALFESAPLMAKDQKGNIIPWNVTGDRWIDGSVENDLPMERLSEIFNVNHFIVSQVNPHIYPFVKHGVEGGGRLRSINRKVMFLIKSEFNYRLDQFATLGIFPRACQILKSILSQKYYGDITILPDLSLDDIAHMFVDRPIEAIQKSIHQGEIATWSKLSVIQSHLQAELVLDEILLRIRDSLIKLIPEINDITEMNVEDVFDDASSDVMLDPTVDIRRHLSPELSVRSLAAVSLSNLTTTDDLKSNGTYVQKRIHRTATS